MNQKVNSLSDLATLNVATKPQQAGEQVEQVKNAPRPKTVPKSTVTPGGVKLSGHNKVYLAEQCRNPQNGREANPYASQLVRKMDGFLDMFSGMRDSLQAIARDIDNQGLLIPPLEDYILALQDHKFSVTFTVIGQIEEFSAAIEREALFIDTARRGGAPYRVALMTYMQKAAHPQPKPVHQKRVLPEAEVTPQPDAPVEEGTSDE
jgi:hypothetical protein